MVFPPRVASDADTEVSRVRLGRLWAPSSSTGWVPAGSPEHRGADVPVRVVDTGRAPGAADEALAPGVAARCAPAPATAEQSPATAVGGATTGEPVAVPAGHPVSGEPRDLPTDDVETWALPVPSGAPTRHRPAPRSAWNTISRWALARLAFTVPRDLRCARLDPNWRGALAVAIAVLLAVAVTAVVVWRGRPTSEPLASSSAVPVLSQARASPRGGTALTPSASLVIDVTGKVSHPGLVHVPPGSRVADAITSAGGALSGTDLSALNLARKVVDGEQIVVGQPTPAGPLATGSGGSPAPAPAGSAASPGAKVNLNIATVADLDTLPGVGPVLAQRIIDYRTAHNGFRAVDQLREVQGIGDARFQDLSSLVTV